MITDVAGKDLWVEVDGDGPLTGQSPFSAVAVGYKLELDAGVEGLKEMHSRGIRVPSGVYLYRMQAGGFARTRKMVILK